MIHTYIHITKRSTRKKILYFEAIPGKGHLTYLGMNQNRKHILSLSFNYSMTTWDDEKGIERTKRFYLYFIFIIFIIFVMYVCN